MLSITNVTASLLIIKHAVQKQGTKLKQPMYIVMHVAGWLLKDKALRKLRYQTEMQLQLSRGSILSSVKNQPCLDVVICVAR